MVSIDTARRPALLRPFPGPPGPSPPELEVLGHERTGRCDAPGESVSLSTFFLADPGIDARESGDEDGNEQRTGQLFEDHQRTNPAPER
jgi:hypothetical protein